MGRKEESPQTELDTDAQETSGVCNFCLGSAVNVRRVRMTNVRCDRNDDTCVRNYQAHCFLTIYFIFFFRLSTISAVYFDKPKHDRRFQLYRIPHKLDLEAQRLCA